MLARRAGFFRTVLAVQAGGVIFLALLAPFLDLPPVSTAQAAYCVALGPLAVFTYLCFYRALELGPLAVVSPVVTAYAAVSLALAVVVLGESLGPGAVVGCVLTIGGVILASVELGSRAPRQPLVGRGVLFGLGAMLGFGFYIFALGAISKDIGWFLPIFFSRISGTVLLAAIAALRDEWPWQRFGSRALALTVAVGVLETCGYLAFNRGTELGYVSIVSAAASVYPLIPVAGAILLLKERISPTQLVGVAVVLAGLVVLAVAG